jgi:cytochrome c peroxidase
MGSRKILSVTVLILVIIALLLFYGKQDQARGVPPVGEPVEIAAPLGLPPVPVPKGNPPTAETVALGRRLYYEPLLSLDSTVSCASCHHPDFGFSDGKQFSEGVGKKKGNRNSPTVLNSAYFATQFWDGRALTLEEQAEGPVENPVEMAHSLKSVERRLNADPSYRAEFEKAFGPGRITYDMVAQAIASFERTVLSGNSPFDRWFYGRDQNAVSESVKRGFEVFRRADKGNCAACHPIAESYGLFTDNQFHNVGVGVKNEMPTDLGRYNISHVEAQRGAFKTPSLRNLTQTAPYMHDGSLKTLKEVVDFYIGGANSNPYLDSRIKPLDFLTGQERADLLAFLESLTGEIPSAVMPPSIDLTRE